MKKQGYDIQQITEVLEKAKFEIPEGDLEPPPPPPPDPNNIDQFMPVQAPMNYFNPNPRDEDNSIVESLTDEDKLALRIKWGKTYKPDEWVQLEKLYNEMMESYDIQSAGHIDTLKMICKTSLKANQLLDIGDVDGAQKMIKMYDMLMKSGKFTAAQNKSESGNAVDSISELVMLCEKDGFFPRYYVDGPQDKVDRTLQDIQNYTHQLVVDEMNLGNLIENAVKQIQIDKEKEALRDADAAGDDDAFEAELFDEDGNLNETGEWDVYFGDTSLIRPFLFIPETQDNVTNYICYQVSTEENMRYNSTMKYLVITFTIFVHEKDSIDKETGIARHDLIGAIIRELMAWSSVTMGHATPIFESESVTDTNYVTKVLKYQAAMPNNLVVTEGEPMFVNKTKA